MTGRGGSCRPGHVTPTSHPAQEGSARPDGASAQKRKTHVGGRRHEQAGHCGHRAGHTPKERHGFRQGKRVRRNWDTLSLILSHLL